jgi:putative acetyltransferase
VSQAEISIADPQAEDVRFMLQRHLAFAYSEVPVQDRHALDANALAEPNVEFYALRVDGELLAVGALRKLDDGHAEVKSMHTAAEARRQGLGRAMLYHLLGVARDGGFRQVSLETGSMPAFAPARSLYESAGFSVCGAFGDYAESANTTFMTLTL